MENNKELYCTLSNEELIKRSQQWIGKLISSGGRDWNLHIPARPNNDPDLLFTELCARLAAPSIGGMKWISRTDRNPNDTADRFVKVGNSKLVAFFDEDKVWKSEKELLLGDDLKWLDESPAASPSLIQEEWKSEENKPLTFTFNDMKLAYTCGANECCGFCGLPSEFGKYVNEKKREFFSSIFKIEIKD